MTFFKSDFFKFLEILIIASVVSLSLAGLITYYNKSIDLENAIRYGFVSVYLAFCFAFLFGFGLSNKNRDFGFVDLCLKINIGITIIAMFKLHQSLVFEFFAFVSLVLLFGSLSRKEFYHPTTFSSAICGFTIMIVSYFYCY